MMNKKKVDLYLVLLVPILASILSLLIDANFLISVFLFLAIPSFYLSYRSPKYIWKVFIYSFLASIPLIIVIGYLGKLNHSWSFPDAVPGLMLFGMIELEIILWAFFNVYFVVIFYEYFLHNHVKVKSWNPRMKNLIILGLTMIIPFVFLFFYLPSVFRIPYFYLVFGLLLFLFPILWQIKFHPSLLNKIFLAGAYFFYLSFIYEIVALQLGWWDFPGNEFIGWVQIFHYSFPIEEFVFWIGLFAIAVLSAFEYLVENDK